MKNLARILRTLALTLWLGGILFFGAVLAPTAFRVLPTIHDAGLVVGASLASLHHIGLICAALIAASSAHSLIRFSMSESPIGWPPATI